MPVAEAKKTKETTKKAAPKAVKKPALRQAQGDSGFAIIETGGKQYRVAVGDSIKIEKLGNDFKVGDKVAFDKVLLTDSDIGTPYIAGVKVDGTITEIGRNKKVIVIHYKQKSRYFKKQGHKQPYFKVKIEKIG